MKQAFNLFLVVIWVFGLNTVVLAGLSEAERLIEEGKLDAALAEVDTMLSRNADDLETRFLKGIILTGQARDDAAVKIYEALTIDYPELPEPYNNLGVLFTQQGKYRNARDALRAAIRIDPSYSTAHENLGDLYAKMASHSYDRALEENSQNKSARLKKSKLNSLFSAPEPGNVKVATIVTKELSPLTTVVESEANQAINKSEPFPEPVQFETQPGDGGEEAIMSTVSGWSSAWSAQDLDLWLSYYSSDFKPSGGLTRKKWVAQRRDRLQKSSFIEVKVEQPKVVVKRDTTARVEFVQTYQADSYSDQVVKVLDMQRENGNWKIYREQSKLLNWQIFQERTRSQ